MTKPTEVQKRALEEAARMLISLGPGDRERPSRPNKEDANRRFTAQRKGDKYKIKEVK